MRTLPSALIAEKNQLDGSEPWLVFLEITMPGDEKEYIVRNNEDITWPSEPDELITNTDFTGDTDGWLDNSAATIASVDGELVVTTTGNYGRAVTSITTIIGKTYELIATGERTSGTGIGLVRKTDSSSGGSTPNAVNVNFTALGQYTLTFEATATTSYIALGSDSTIIADIFTFDNVSVKEPSLTTPQLYTAVPFELDMIEDSGSGEIPRVNLKISNVQRMLQGYLESYDGAIGATVKMTIVSVDHLDEDYSEFESTFDVIGSSANYEWVTFTLGAPNPLKQRFPLNKYIAKHCNWHYGSVECGHTGDASCDRTFAACEAKSNGHRFGGYFGLSKVGIRLV